MCAYEILVGRCKLGGAPDTRETWLLGCWGLLAAPFTFPRETSGPLGDIWVLFTSCSVALITQDQLSHLPPGSCGCAPVLILPHPAALRVLQREDEAIHNRSERCRLLTCPESEESCNDGPKPGGMCQII